LKNSPIVVLYAVISFVFFCFVCPLSIFHMYLVSTNQTTYEFLSNRKNCVNPHDRGCLSNWYKIFCTSIPKSKLSRENLQIRV
jgi:hypothetical protein